MMKPANVLHKLGQSLWLDNIARELLNTGTLQRFIEEFSVTGFTSIPTIFDHAIRYGATYDDDISRKKISGKSADDLFFELALADLTRAAELFQPVFARTDGVDGWVSLEVSPLLAHDTNATLAAARMLHQRAGKPNLFIEFPAQRKGYQRSRPRSLPAFRSMSRCSSPAINISQRPMLTCAASSGASTPG